MRDFRAGKTGFFADPRPGPTRAPAKNAACEKIIELRRAGHSVKEISELLADTPTPLNRTGVAEVLAEAGFGRLPVRPPGERGAPYRDHPAAPRFSTSLRRPSAPRPRWPGRCWPCPSWLLLAVPELVALDLPALVGAAGYPGTAVLPAVNYVLSLLTLTLVGIRRVSHVDDLAAEVGAALFAGLVALPKATALSTYSHRPEHTRQSRMFTQLGKAMLGANLIADAGGDLDLDLHAIMHWGQDVALEKNYVPRRSQRTRSVLSFFAQDSSTDTLVYANADLTKATQAHEVLVFANHWRAITGGWPTLLVMDQKVTTQPVLGQLVGIGFLNQVPTPTRPRRPTTRPRTAVTPTTATPRRGRRRRHRGHWLLLRRNFGTGELAFCRAFSPTPTTLRTLARVAGRRWAVEGAFQSGKELAGLDEHQVRGCTSWHR